jgi:hypothetical protein
MNHSLHQCNSRTITSEAVGWGQGDIAVVVLQGKLVLEFELDSRRQWLFTVSMLLFAAVSMLLFTAVSMELFRAVSSLVDGVPALLVVHDAVEE